MQNWRKALESFLNDFQYASDLAGVLVCGSFVTGNPSARSDIDVHLILKEGKEWRERGNEFVDGYLIEYFCNPPVQIRKYFEEDHYSRTTHAAVQFATGEILWDKEGSVAGLKEEAGVWLNKPFKEIGDTEMEFMKYGIWDTLDNLQDMHEKEEKGITFAYHNSLNLLFDQYCRYLSVEQIPYYQIGAYLSDKRYLKKYLKPPFPDEEFSRLFKMAMNLSETEQMADMYEKLSEYVLSQMGGFSIDGWQMRSPIEN
ncbi:hypothetical protein FZC79_16515 [Rossellomorea vietnamensis]|uniref:Polymerase nucleotidyl transferase domain-containing protein n=1 Tax=Rossellomorea vietnamensis TaxID=218284 RepID=A0A5D4KD23_9BACI|nr:hypothetical protein [Rossellomorea vietnamensis]TYR74053.1 hypothetical protein FZC79_16515 [Rossellomorea vietnamensis]